MFIFAGLLKQFVFIIACYLVANGVTHFLVFVIISSHLASVPKIKACVKDSKIYFCYTQFNFSPKDTMWQSLKKTKTKREQLLKASSS